MRRKARGSLPYFDKVRDVVALSTPDGMDHGWMVFIARDPMSGYPNRYSVFKVNCQTGRIANYACECDLELCWEIRRDLVNELVAKGAKDPKRIEDWGYFPSYVPRKSKSV